MPAGISHPFTFRTVNDAGWTPALLSNQVAWYRADKGTNTTTNGANVTSWADQFGLQADFSSSSVTKPTYVVNAVHGKPAIQSNGASNCNMQSTSSTAWKLQNGFSIVMIMTFDNHNANNCYISKGNTDAAWDQTDLSSTGTSKAITTGIATVNHTSSATTDLADGKWFCAQTDLTSGGTLSWFVNGASLGSTASALPGSTATNVWIFTRPDTLTRLTGKIAEIIVTSAPITGSELASMKSYIFKRYNIVMA